MDSLSESCKSCVSGGSYWVTLLNSTNLCIYNLARWAEKYIKAIENDEDCPPPEVSGDSGKTVGILLSVIAVGVFVFGTVYFLGRRSQRQNRYRLLCNEVEDIEMEENYQMREEAEDLMNELQNLALRLNDAHGPEGRELGQAVPIQELDLPESQNNSENSQNPATVQPTVQVPANVTVQGPAEMSNAAKPEDNPLGQVPVQVQSDLNKQVTKSENQVCQNGSIDFHNHVGCDQNQDQDHEILQVQNLEGAQNDYENEEQNQNANENQDHQDEHGLVEAQNFVPEIPNHDAQADENNRDQDQNQNQNQHQNPFQALVSTHPMRTRSKSGHSKSNNDKHCSGC